MEPPVPLSKVEVAGENARGKREMMATTRKHALLVLLPPPKEDPALGAKATDRFVNTVRQLLCEYVLSAQHMQPDTSSIPSRGTRKKGDVGQDVLVTRLLLSVRVLPWDPRAAAGAIQLLGGDRDATEQPALISARNPKILQDVCSHFDACVVRNQQRDLEGIRAVSTGTERAEAFGRALQSFEGSSASMSVISRADCLPLLSKELSRASSKSNSLASVLKRIENVQFVLLRSDDERADLASRNILHLVRTVNTRSEASCTIRQFDTQAFQVRSLVKEWLHLAAPSVTCTIVRHQHHANRQREGPDSSDTTRIQLEIRSNFVFPHPGPASVHAVTNALHSGLRYLEIRDVVPLSSVYPTVVLGCPLHGLPVTADPTTMFTNSRKVKTFAKYLRAQKSGAVLQCIRSYGEPHMKEFYLLVPADESSSRTEFLLFRLASAEEIFLADITRGDGIMSDTADFDDEDDDVVEWLEQIPKQPYNPFRYESGAPAACLDTKKTCSLASNSKKPNPASKRKAKVKEKASSYAPIPTAKRKRLLQQHSQEDSWLSVES